MDIAGLLKGYQKVSTLREMNDGVLVLFGASKRGEEALGVLLAENVRVECLCDNDPAKWGNYIRGVRVVSPAELSRFPVNKTNVAITSMYVQEIASQLRSLGFSRIYHYFIDNEVFIDHYRPEFILEKSARLESLLNILEDNESKKVLLNLIKYRLTMTQSMFRRIGDESICFTDYFPEDLFSLTDNEILVDAGAYNGDTIAQFLKKTGYKFKKIYAFEPDTYNFQELHDFIFGKGLEQKVTIEKIGLYNDNTMVPFSNNGTMWSGILPDGIDLVSVVKLDDFLGNDPVTVIKMDIEGSEKEAILGAVNVVVSNKPRMAICTYHKARDLWEIPRATSKSNFF